MKILTVISAIVTFILLASCRPLFDVYPPYGIVSLLLAFVSFVFMLVFSVKSMFKNPTKYFKENPNVGFLRIMLNAGTQEIIATLVDEPEVTLEPTLNKNKVFIANPSYFIKEGQHTVNIEFVPKNKRAEVKKYTVDVTITRGQIYNVTINEKTGNVRVGVIPKTSARELKKHIELLEQANNEI